MIRVSVNQKSTHCFISVEWWLNNEHSGELINILDGFLSFRYDRTNRIGGKPLEIEGVGIMLRSFPPVPAVNLSKMLVSRSFMSVFDGFLSSNPPFSVILCGGF